MISLFTLDEFKNGQVLQKFDFKCSHCHKIFSRTKSYINAGFCITTKKCTKKFLSLNDYLFKRRKFCSHQCQHLTRNTKIWFKCTNCQKPILRRSKIDNQSKVNNRFCCQSCAATYNNLHKKFGTKISKLELWLQKQLEPLYPNLKFEFNQKDVINSELDIYIPSLKLAFELNGIYHYEPIHGQLTLEKSQNNDRRKFQACLELGIELCIIDTSHQTYFKEQTSKKYLDIITNLIENALKRTRTSDIHGVNVSY